MAIGTAGFTRHVVRYGAGRRRVSPDAGTILVTGATGGLAVLHRVVKPSCHTVAALTGKPESHALSACLGAAKLSAVKAGIAAESCWKPSAGCRRDCRCVPRRVLAETGL